MRNKSKFGKAGYIISFLLLSIVYLDWWILKGELSKIIPYTVIYGVVFLLGITLIDSTKKILNGKYLDISHFLTAGVYLAVLLIFRGSINHFLSQQINLFGDYNQLVLYMHIKMVVKLSLYGFGLIASPVLLRWLDTNFKRALLRYKESELRAKGVIILLLVFLLFLLVRLYFIFSYSGNYPDDWYHIIAGVRFAETGELPTLNRYFNDSGYLRGLYVTFMVSLYSKIFGNGIDIFQLVPLTISVVNFFLFNNILKKVIINNNIRYLILVAYTLMPYTIFTHIYIRMYVYYEMFILLALNAVHLAMNYLTKKRLTSLSFLLLFSGLLYFLAQWLSNDNGFLIVTFVLGLLFIYIVLGEIPLILNRYYRGSKISELIGKISPRSLVVLLGLAFILVYVYIRLLVNISTNPGGIGTGFTTFLFGNYHLLLIFIPLAFIGLNKDRNFQRRVFVTLGAVLLPLLTAFPPQLDLIRGLTILFPIILLPIGVGIENAVVISGKYKNVLYAFILSLALLLTFASYPRTFFSIGPSIPSEIAYNEYSKVFNYAKSNLGDREIVHSVYYLVPQMYWGLDKGYVINIDDVADIVYPHGNIFAIESLDELKRITKSKGVCIVLMNYSEEVLLNEETVEYIRNKYETEVEGSGIKLVCN